MRQVLLAAQEQKTQPLQGNGKGKGKGKGNGNGHHGHSKPFVMWMNDDAEIGDAFSWRGEILVVSAIYGTHLSASALVRKCDRPRRAQDSGIGTAVPIDR